MESELENIRLVSSANKVGSDVLFIMYGKSLLYNRKNSGPSIEPYGILLFNSVPIRTIFGI